MTSFRIREYGTADWAQLDISGGESELEEQLAEQVRSLLTVDGLHAQELVDSEWEDLE